MVLVYIQLSQHVLTGSSDYLWRISLFLLLLAPSATSSRDTLQKYPDYSVMCQYRETPSAAGNTKLTFNPGLDLPVLLWYWFTVFPRISLSCSSRTCLYLLSSVVVIHVCIKQVTTLDCWCYENILQFKKKPNYVWTNRKNWPKYFWVIIVFSNVSLIQSL